MKYILLYEIRFTVLIKFAQLPLKRTLVYGPSIICVARLKMALLSLIMGAHNILCLMEAFMGL